MSAAHIAVHLPIWPEPGTPRPRLRAECASLPRPCPFPDCRHHLAADSQGPPFVYSCALDAADDGAHTIDEVAEILGATREEIRDVEIAALRKLRTALRGPLRSVAAEDEEPPCQG